MNYRRRVHLVAALVVANIVLGGYVLYRYSSSGGQSSATPADHPRTLPRTELRDDKGRILNTEGLLGNFLFVQFINSSIDDQVDSIASVLRNRPKRPISWLLITNNAHLLRERVSIVERNILVVDDGYEHLRTLFGVPGGVESQLIFDDSGKLLHRSFYHEGGTAARLRSLVDGEKNYSPRMLIEVVAAAPEGKFAQLRAQTLHSRLGKAVVALFSSVDTICPSGAVMNLLNNYAARDDGVEYLALVPSAFDQTDINNLKTNLEVAFPVETASEEASVKWTSLIEQYGERPINGTVILIDRGEVSAVHGIGEISSLLAEL